MQRPFTLEDTFLKKKKLRFLLTTFAIMVFFNQIMAAGTDEALTSVGSVLSGNDISYNIHSSVEKISKFTCDFDPEQH